MQNYTIDDEANEETIFKIFFHTVNETYVVDLRIRQSI